MSDTSPERERVNLETFNFTSLKSKKIRWERQLKSLNCIFGFGLLKSSSFLFQIVCLGQGFRNRDIFS